MRSTLPGIPLFERWIFSFVWQDVDFKEDQTYSILDLVHASPAEAVSLAVIGQSDAGNTLQSAGSSFAGRALTINAECQENNTLKWRNESFPSWWSVEERCSRRVCSYKPGAAQCYLLLRSFSCRCCMNKVGLNKKTHTHTASKHFIYSFSFNPPKLLMIQS